MLILMKSFINLSIYDLIRLAVIGQPGFFENLSGVSISAYEMNYGNLYFCVTKYYLSNTHRTYRFDKVPNQLSNLSFVQKLFKYGHVNMEGRKIEVWIDLPNSHQVMEGGVAFLELQSEFKF